MSEFVAPLKLIVHNSRVAVIGTHCLTAFFRAWGITTFLSDFFFPESITVTLHDDDSCGRRRYLESQSLPLPTELPLLFNVSY